MVHETRRLPHRSAHRFRWWSPFAGLALVSFAACDIPTEAPRFESRWIVPAEVTRFSVGELLPEQDVRFNADSSAFVVDFDPVQFSETLGSLCPACVAVNGLTVPKPPFVGGFESGVDFPDRVSSVAVSGGEVEVTVRNDLNFDPIRPEAGGATGSLVIEVRDGADGDVLGTLLVDGATTAFPPLTSLVRTLPLAATAVDGGLLADVRVDSPLGDPVQMDVSLGISATATPRDVTVSRVDVDVAGEDIALDPVSLDTEELDAELVDRIEEGAFILDVVNPFGIGADFSLVIQGPTISTITRSVAVGPEPTSSYRVDFTRAELQSFLGEPGVTLEGSAVVDAGAGTISLAPGQELVLDARFDVTLQVGGSGS